MVSVYEYMDYRKFLNDSYEERKIASKSMSYRSFARIAGFSSWNFLKFVIQGKRNLTLDSIEKFARAFKLKKRETQFFKHLVLMNQATKPEDKKREFESLMSFKRFADIHSIESNLYRFFSNWYIAAVHELVSLPDFDADPSWIAKKLHPRITRAQAKESLKVLQQLDLIKVDARSGKAKHTKKHIASPHRIAGMAAAKFQREMAVLAAQSLVDAPTNRRDLSGITVALSETQYDETLKMIREFRRELHAKLAEGKKADAVYQINFQLFPLSEVKS